MLRPLFTTFLLALVGGWSLQLTNASNILALFINGHRSHMLLYTSIVNLLLDRGHNVTVITTLEVQAFHSAPDNLKWIQLSSNYTRSRNLPNSNAFERIESMMTRIGDTAEFMFDPTWQMFVKDTRQQFDLMLLGYLFNDYQLGVAAHFKCPSVVIWTGQPIGFIHRLMGNPENRWYVPQPYDRHQYKGWRGMAFGWFEKFVETLALYKMKEVYEQHFPESQYPTFWEVRRNVSLALVNHHSLSEGPIAPYVPSIIEIGGLEYPKLKHSKTLRDDYDDGDDELQDLLIKANHIIYLSFGSRVKWSMLDEKLETIFIEAFKLFPNYTIIWTYDKNCVELEKRARNIKCRAWWPQTSILEWNKTQLFITHGGKGSISESYRYAKPILGFAFFGDQRANVARIAEKQLGIGLNIYELTLPKLVDALKELLGTEKYAQNALKFSQLYQDRPVGSEESVIYWLEYVIRHDGANHLQSPFLELNFFEYYCLDVYLCFVVIFIISIKFLNCLEMKLALKS
ncbi:UDP-glycosyltransferase family 307 member A1 [Musca autumnalis]|uniref:UDP-glycosyltransferase family 307 member A1 n=1 Tax=Musca autumnalis TaxID=221902 RepID=UPI003CF4221D